MKKGIHPASRPIRLILTDGSTVEVNSTYGKDGDESANEIRLDIDPLKHPAWNKDGGSLINANAGKVAKFNSKYGGFSLGGKKPAAANADGDKPEDKKSEAN